MKLQILIPHYDEAYNEIENLLNSISIQQSVDLAEVGVIIAYDGPKAIELPISEWNDSYSFEVKQVSLPEKLGVSEARNAALRAAKADYVMFCDADDMFCHVCGLYIIFNEIEAGFDTLTSMFIEETRNPETGEPVYVNHEMDSTFVHGKVHRRKFLMQNNLKFNPNLTVHEDSYFNVLVQSIANPNRAKYCPTAFYLWKWRDASVCRHDPKYILKTYSNMIDSNDALVSELLYRKLFEKAQFHSAVMIFDAYYTMNKKEWIDTINADYRHQVDRRFKSYLKKYKYLWDELKDQDKMMISNNVRSRSVLEGMPMESITIEDWLNFIENL